MNVTFFDREDQANPLNGVVIRDNELLFRILEGLHTRPPFISELIGENGFCLLVGVGSNGFVQYSHCDGSPPYLAAVTPSQDSQDGETEFLTGGTPTPISNRYCMPFDIIREIAGYFRETGLTHPAFTWEGI